jgi:hypothetical protein
MTGVGIEHSVALNNSAISTHSESIKKIPSGGHSVTPVQVTGNGVTKLKFVRAENIQLLETVLAGGAQLGENSTISQCNAQIAAGIGNPNSRDYLGNIFANLISGLNVANPSSPGAKEEAMNQVTDFCGSVQKYATHLEEVRQDLETKIDSRFTEISQILGRLADINSKMQGEDFTRQDERNDLLKQLSQLINIKADINPTNGTVLIRASSKTNSVELLSNDKYATFYYTEDTNSPTQKVQIQYIGSNGNDDTTTTMDIDKTTGGEIGGLISSRTIVDQAAKNIDAVAANIADQINKMHNLGSGHPPLNTLTSSTDVALNDKAVYTGKILIGVTDNTGQPINNLLRPLDLNFTTMLKKSGTSVLTVDEVAKEINNEAACDAQAGVGVGSGVYGDPNSFLINNMSLVTSDIDATGRVGVQFRLSSGSPIDTTFEVLEARVANAAGAEVPGAVGTLPGVFNLKAGETAKTNQNIVLSFANGGTEDQASLWVRVRAVGVGANAEGTNQEVWARYNFGAGGGPILAGQDIWNSRIQAVAVPGVVPGAGAGGIPLASVTAAKVGGPQVNAAVQDGKLVIRSMGDTTGLMIIQDSANPSKISKIGASNSDLPKGFSQHFNLRNLINYDPQKPAATLAVLDTNSDNLALTIPTLVAKAPRVVPVPGVNKAGATFTLVALPAANDTVTINGQTFTFVAGVPANNSQVQIGGSTQTTIANLLSKLQANTSTTLNPLLTFSINPGNLNQLVVTAKYAGTRGNLITLGSAIGGGAPANIWANTAIPGGGAGTLDNGTDQPAGTTGSIDIYDYTYEIGANLGGTFKGLSSSIQMTVGGKVVSMTLEKFFNDFLSAISTTSKLSKEDEEVAKKIVEKLDAAYKAETVFDKNALLLEAVQLANMNKLLYEMIRLIMRNEAEVLTIGRG